MSDKLLKRIAALFALSDNNPSPEEAQSALEQARTLLQKHNLTMIDVENVGEERGAVGGYSETATVGKKVPQWKKSLSVIVAEYFDVKVVIRKYVNRQESSFLFYGLVFNTTIAIGVFLSLLKQIGKMSNDYRGKGYYAKDEYRNGIITGLDRRLTFLKMWQGQKCTVLAVCSNKVADEWMENEKIKVRKARVKSKKQTKVEERRKDRKLGWDRQFHFQRGVGDAYSLVLEKALEGETEAKED